MTIRLLTLLFALCLGSTAGAQNNWSVPGNVCIPSAATIKSDLHRTTLAAVRHAGTKVGTILLTCQMERFNSGTAAWNLKLTYQDSTGTGTTAFVRARLYRMAIGSVTPVLLATVSSNSSASTDVNTASSSELAHTFDFEVNTYWVRVELKRKSSSETVILHSIVLDGTSV